MIFIYNMRKIYLLKIKIMILFICKVNEENLQKNDRCRFAVKKV